MKISIVTPCRNAERFIADTVESVIFQGGDFEIEYIVVDGASTDRTVEIVEQYLQKVEKKTVPLNCLHVSMKLVSEADEGMYDAVVKGLRQVSGDVAAYLNADDFYQPNAFRVLRDLFSDLPRLNWLTGVPTFYNWQGLIIESDWPVIYDNRFIRKGLYNNKALPYIQQESVFFRPGLLDSVEFERLKRLKYAGDAYLWNCFAERSPLFVVSAILSGYRLHSENLAITSGNSYANEMNSISEYTGLTEEEYNYLLFAHLTWWRGSKPVKESNNGRYITWDTDRHCWKADHLDYELAYKLPYAEIYLEYIATKPAGYIRNYVDRHLVP